MGCEEDSIENVKNDFLCFENENGSLFDDEQEPNNCQKSIFDIEDASIKVEDESELPKQEEIDDSSKDQIEELKIAVQEESIDDSDHNDTSYSSSCSRSSAQSDNSGFKIIPFIYDFLRGINRKQGSASNSNKRGRPRKKVFNSKEDLAKMMSQWLNEFRKMNSKKRSDSKFTSVMRKLKNIPYKCLTHIGRKSEFKSDEMKKFTSGFLETYCEIFVLIFRLDDLSTEEHFEMFLDFIFLKFPEDKVRKIYKKILEEDDTLYSVADKLESFDERSKKTSKAYFKIFYKTNRCFKTIASKIEPIIVSACLF